MKLEPLNLGAMKDDELQEAREPSLPESQDKKSSTSKLSPIATTDTRGKLRRNDPQSSYYQHLIPNSVFQRDPVLGAKNNNWYCTQSPKDSSTLQFMKGIRNMKHSVQVLSNEDYKTPSPNAFANKNRHLQDKIVVLPQMFPQIIQNG